MCTGIDWCHPNTKWKIFTICYVQDCKATQASIAAVLQEHWQILEDIYIYIWSYSRIQNKDNKKHIWYIVQKKIKHHTHMCFWNAAFVCLFFSYSLRVFVLRQSKCIFQFIGPLFRNLVVGVLHRLKALRLKQVGTLLIKCQPNNNLLKKVTLLHTKYPCNSYACHTKPNSSLWNKDHEKNCAAKNWNISISSCCI